MKTINLKDYIKPCFNAKWIKYYKFIDYRNIETNVISVDDTSDYDKSECYGEIDYIILGNAISEIILKNGVQLELWNWENFEIFDTNPNEILNK